MARFVTTFGLSGELAAGMILILESASGLRRGLLTGGICAFAFTGPLLAFGLMDEKWTAHRVLLLGHDWEQIGLANGYLVGAGLGLLVLLLRISVGESKVFLQHRQKNNKALVEPAWVRAQQILRQIFAEKQTFLCILVIGMQTAMVNGILMPALVQPNQPRPMLASIYFISHAIGVVVAGYLSDRWKSHKKVLLWLQYFSLLAFALYFWPLPNTLSLTIVRIFALGVANSFWPLFVLLSIEHFGVGCRNTATTLLLNLSRTMILLYGPLMEAPKENGEVALVPWAAMTVCVCVWALSFGSLRKLKSYYPTSKPN